MEPRVISVAVLICALVFFAWFLNLTYNTASTEMAVFVLCISVAGTLGMLSMVNNAFVTLRVNEECCEIARLSGTIRIKWSQVRTVENWIKVQRISLANTVREAFLRLVGDNKRTLFLMTSNFDKEAFVFVTNTARRHGIPVTRHALISERK